MGETEDHEPAGGPKRRFVPSSEKLEVPRSTEGSLAILLLQKAQKICKDMMLVKVLKCQPEGKVTNGWNH